MRTKDRKEEETQSRQFLWTDYFFLGTFGILFVVAAEPVLDAQVLQVLLHLLLVLEIYSSSHSGHCGDHKGGRGIFLQWQFKLRPTPTSTLQKLFSHFLSFVRTTSIAEQCNQRFWRKVAKFSRSQHQKTRKNDKLEYVKSCVAFFGLSLDEKDIFAVSLHIYEKLE